MRASGINLLAAVALAAPALPSWADDVPDLNIAVTCRAGAQAYPGGGGEAACLRDEREARATLARQWAQYPAESRVRCARMVNDIPGTQSYIELLSCVEMARDVQNLPKRTD